MPWERITSRSDNYNVMHCLEPEVLNVLSQVREDRDNYVTINFDNINPGSHHNFDLFEGSVNFGSCYDYFSVMHYGLTE